MALASNHNWFIIPTLRSKSRAPIFLLPSGEPIRSRYRKRDKPPAFFASCWFYDLFISRTTVVSFSLSRLCSGRNRLPARFSLSFPPQRSSGNVTLPMFFSIILLSKRRRFVELILSHPTPSVHFPIESEIDVFLSDGCCWLWYTLLFLHFCFVLYITHGLRVREYFTYFTYVFVLFLLT